MAWRRGCWAGVEARGGGGSPETAEGAIGWAGGPLAAFPFSFLHDLNRQVALLVSEPIADIVWCTGACMTCHCPGQKDELRPYPC